MPFLRQRLRENRRRFNRDRQGLQGRQMILFRRQTRKVGCSNSTSLTTGSLIKAMAPLGQGFRLKKVVFKQGRQCMLQHSRRRADKVSRCHLVLAERSGSFLFSRNKLFQAVIVDCRLECRSSSARTAGKTRTIVQCSSCASLLTRPWTQASTWRSLKEKVGRGRRAL